MVEGGSLGTLVDDAGLVGKFVNDVDLIEGAGFG